MKPHLLLSFVLGCHPQPAIKAFNVAPLTYCPSSTRSIDIDWSTEKGDTTLQVAPDDPVPRKVSPTGKMSIAPHEVNVTLTVAKGELAPHRDKVVRAAGRHPMSAPVTDAGGGKCTEPWVISDATDFGGGPNAFDPHVHPAIITNACGRDAKPGDTCHRDVRIEHAGRTWRIAPNGVLDLRNESVTMAGAWTLSQQLLPGEECGTSTASAALEVDLFVEIDCK